MKIEYQDGGEESRLLITSWFFDWREHNRLVDEVLFCAPRLRAVDEGFFRRNDGHFWCNSVGHVCRSNG